MTNEMGSGITPKKSRRWTPELRARQARKTRQAQPWTKTTGPKTTAGKDSAKMNAAKHGLRSAVYRAICHSLREQKTITETALLRALLDLEKGE